MKKLICVMLVFVCATVLFACSNNKADPSSGTGSTGQAVKDTLTVIVSADPNSLNPYDNVSNYHHQVTRQIYETLFVRDNDGKFQPWLAESYEYEDDITIIMQIRQGVYFHNGDELKASDVLFSLQQMRDTNATMQVASIDFDKTCVEGEYTIKIVTLTPYPALFANLENPMTCIINEKVYTEYNGSFPDEASIGTGPYKVVRYVSGDKITLVAHDRYWVPDQPIIKNLVMRFISDSSARAIEAESGGADIVYDITNNNIDLVSAAPNVNLERAVGTRTEIFTLNASVKPLDDIRVRQAIFYAIDQDQIVKIAYGNFGVKATGVISPGVDGRIDLSDSFIKRDLNRSRELLTEAGFPNGFDLELTTPNNDQMRMDSCEAVQAQLAEVGINAKIIYAEYNVFLTDIIDGKTAMSVYGPSAATGESGRILLRYLPETPESKMLSWYDDEYMRITREALETIDDARRNELFAQGQRMLLEACVYYPIWHKELNAALQNNVKGFKLQTSYEHHYLQSVYFE